MDRRRHDNRRTLGVLLLMNELIRGGPVPPITLAAVVAQVAVYLEMVPMLSARFTSGLCLLPAKILKRKEWIRLFAPLIMHADDMHLYYNMASFMWKGRRLEPYLGPVRYGLTLIALSIASALLTVALSVGLDESRLFPEQNFSHQCAVGFSGVIFALKVLCNKYTPQDVWLMGLLPVPSRYACWAELLLIQVLTPNASFVGHLAGIVAGLLYTMGPLQWIVEIPAQMIESLFFQGRGGPEGPQYADEDQWGNGRPTAPRAENDWGEGRRARRSPSPTSRRQYDHYTGGLTEEEQIQRAMEESLRQRGRQPQQPQYGWNID